LPPQSSYHRRRRKFGDHDLADPPPRLAYGCTWSPPSSSWPSPSPIPAPGADGAHERQTLLHSLAVDPDLIAARQGQTLIADNDYRRDSETDLTEPIHG